ncbi:hypothetical protein BDQ17DRAFT_1391086 [Cyathus striatus]|nr:hypothetical protein BDQ17DRAFT_1391086 [Cyathus striatus]
MSHHIISSSISTYLSGIVHLLEPYYPTRSLHSRKPPLPLSLLSSICVSHQSSRDHDTLLCLATGFFGLLRLGELVTPDNLSNFNRRKVTSRSSTTVSPAKSYQFTLPTHKAERLFEGNVILIQRLFSQGPDPAPFFSRYLFSCDTHFPFHHALWLRADGSLPNCSFFLSFLHRVAGDQFSGHSLRSGGATALAEHGVSHADIQHIGLFVDAGASTSKVGASLHATPTLLPPARVPDWC